MEAILALLLVFGVLLLFLPLRLGFSGRYYGIADAAFRVRLRPWVGLWGVQAVYGPEGLQVGPMLGPWVPVRFTLGGKERVEAAPEVDEEATEGEEGEEEEKPSLWEWAGDVRERISLARAYIGRLKGPLRRFAGRVWRAVQLRRFSGAVTFGAFDPATTGRLYGYSLAFLGVLGAGDRMRITPDFERGRLEGAVEVVLWVYLYRLVWASGCLAVRFAGAWLAEVWAGWRARRVAARATT